MDKVRILEIESKMIVRQVPDNMTEDDIIEAAQLLMYNAVDLVEAVKYIQKKAPLLPYTIHGPRFVNKDP
jgi:hypothetical protein